MGKGYYAIQQSLMKEPAPDVVQALVTAIMPVDAIKAQSKDYYAHESGYFCHRPDVNKGLYFLLLHDDLVYVGQATDLGGRLAAHSKTDKRWNKAYWIESEDALLIDFLESYYIHTLSPAYNQKKEYFPEWAKAAISSVNYIR